MSKVILGNVPRRVPATSKVRPPTEAIPANFDPAVAVSYTTSSATSHTFLIPENSRVGDIGMALIRAQQSVTIPSGWTELAQADTNKTKVIWRRFDGTETDSTFSTGSSANSVGFTWIIPKGEASSLPDPEISAVAFNSGTNIDTASLTPATAGRTLVMSMWFHGNVSYTESDAHLPTGYEYIGPGLTKQNSPFQRINAAYAFVDITTSENPPAWNLVGTSWHGWTVGVLMDDTGAAVAAGDHTHVEADITDLDHWTESDHDALDHTGLTGVGTDADAIHDNVAGEIAAVTAKASPVSGDFLLIEDSEASNAKKSITIGDLPGGGSGSVEVKKAGSTVGTRSAINFIEGTDITLTVTDDAGNDEVDVTITSAAAGGGVVDSIAGLSCWLKPESLAAIAAGTPLSYWPDSSGRAAGPYQTVEANCPTVRASVLDGFSGAEFDGTNDRMTLFPSPFGWDEFTVFLVLENDAASGLRLALGGQGNDGTNSRLYVGSSGTGLYARAGGGTDSGDVESNTISANDTYIHVVRGTGGTFQSYINGGTAESGSFANSGWDAVRLGCFETIAGSPSSFFDGHIIELIAFVGALSDANVNTVGGYIDDKYASLTWTDI